MFDHSSLARVLLGLRQGSTRVIDYAIQFRILAANSGWNLPAIKDAFVNSLYEGIKDQLVPHESPDEFEDLETTVSGRGRRSVARLAGGPPSHRGTVAYWEFCRSPGFSAPTVAEDQAPPPAREEPMQLGRTKLAPEERQCHKEGACFYCSQSDLLPGAPIPKARLYVISGPERKAMDEYIEASLRSGIIRPSSSPSRAGFFFLLQQARVFTKLDLWNAYHLVRIREGDQWKTGFNTPTGNYEYLVMPFGLTNAPAVFQGFINEVLCEFLNDFVFVCLDDIFIFSPDPVTHQHHVRQVLIRLLEHQLYCEGGEMQVPRLLSLIPGFDCLAQPDQDGPGEGRIHRMPNRMLSLVKHVAMSQPALSAPEARHRGRPGWAFSSHYQCHTDHGHTYRWTSSRACLRPKTTWSNHLMWVEYAHNMLPTAATGLSPFEVIHSYQPPLFPANEKEVTVPSAHASFLHTRRCKKIWAAARQMLLREQVRKKQTVIAAQLSTCTCQARKSLRVHPTFHVSRLKPVNESSLVPPSKPPPLLKMVDDGPIYVVKKLLAVRKTGRGGLRT
ncbi:hypothetical protein L3Q82_019280 [Scortum barcoo]|uniref:Uncharacterized protein n=1 Tax=Scortum barcoo TaxID=214431 RepID=A0ACB8VCR3_9TELE|nr:hypothetical protein L3Q82_019280 [Scortum barcoo]